MDIPRAELFPLGGTKIMLSTVGLGCWQFSRRRHLAGRYWPMVEEAEIKAIVRASLESGVNWFDTAQAYGGGESERMLAGALAALKVKPGDVHVATKWDPFLKTSRSLLRTIEERLGNLGGYPISLHQVHHPTAVSTVRSQMRAMARLVGLGKIRAVGVSNFSAQRMRAAHEALAGQGLKLAANQVRYSLLDRRIESNGVLDTARQLGIMIIAYSPLAQGLVSGKFHDDPGLVRRRQGFRRFIPAFWKRGLDKSRPVILSLREVAAHRSVTPSQAALRWLVQAGEGRVLVIPGATSVAQAVENAEAMNFRLTGQEMDGLEKASRIYLK